MNINEVDLITNGSDIDSVLLQFTQVSSTYLKHLGNSVPEYVDQISTPGNALDLLGMFVLSDFMNSTLEFYLLMTPTGVLRKTMI